MSKEADLTGQVYNICQNCRKEWLDEELQPASDIWDRVEAGELMPSGECPECGALCHPVECYATKDLLDALRRIASGGHWQCGCMRIAREAIAKAVKS